MCVCSEFAKRLIPSVERVGLKAFEALDIDSVKKAEGRRPKVAIMVEANRRQELFLNARATS
jgi:hypothetical protein